MSASVHFPLRGSHFHYSPKKKRPVRKYPQSMTKSIASIAQNRIADERAPADSKEAHSILKRSRNDQSSQSTPASTKRAKAQDPSIPLMELRNNRQGDPSSPQPSAASMRFNRLPPLLRSASTCALVHVSSRTSSAGSATASSPSRLRYLPESVHYRLYGQSHAKKSSLYRLESVYATPPQRMACRKPDFSKELKRAHDRVCHRALDLGPCAQELLATAAARNAHPPTTLCAPGIVIGTHAHFLQRLSSFKKASAPAFTASEPAAPAYKHRMDVRSVLSSPGPLHDLPSSPPVEDDDFYRGGRSADTRFKCSVCLLGFPQEGEMQAHYKLCNAGRDVSIQFSRQTARKYVTRSSTDVLARRTTSPPAVTAEAATEPYRSTRLRTKSGENLPIRRPPNTKRQDRHLVQQDEQVDIIGCVCLIPKDDPLYRMIGLNKRGRKPQIRDQEVIIQCDVCQLWLHARCIRMQDKDISNTLEYICPKCTFITKSRQRQYARVKRSSRPAPPIVERREEYVDVVGDDDDDDDEEEEEDDGYPQDKEEVEDEEYAEHRLFSDDGTVTDHYDPIMTSSPGSYLFKSTTTTPGARTTLRHEWSIAAAWTEDDEEDDEEDEETVVEHVPNHQHEIVEYALHDTNTRPARKSVPGSRSLSLVIQPNHESGGLSGAQTAVQSPIEVGEPPLLGGIVVDDEDKRDLVQRMITTTTPGWVAGILTDHSVGASRLGYRSRHAAFDCSSPTPSVSMRTLTAESLLTDGLDTSSSQSIRPPTSGLVILRPSSQEKTQDSLGSSFLEDFLNIEAFSDEA